MAINTLETMQTQWQQLPAGHWMDVQNGQFVVIPKPQLSKWEQVKHTLGYRSTSYEAIAAVVDRAARQARRELIAAEIEKPWVQKTVSRWSWSSGLTAQEYCNAYDFALKSERVDRRKDITLGAVLGKIHSRNESFAQAIFFAVVRGILDVPLLIIGMFRPGNSNEPSIRLFGTYSVRQIFHTQTGSDSYAAEQEPNYHSLLSDIINRHRRFQNLCQSTHIGCSRLERTRISVMHPAHG